MNKETRELKKRLEYLIKKRDILINFQEKLDNERAITYYDTIYYKKTGEFYVRSEKWKKEMKEQNN